MESFFTNEHIQTIILYACFGSILGTYIYWLGYGIIAGVRWIIKKMKHRSKEEKTNE